MPPRKGSPRLNRGQIWWSFQADGQHASLNSLRHTMESGTDNSFARCFNISADMQSGPVALDTSSFDNNLNMVLERKATKSSNSISGIPKYGQSISSGGSSAFLSKIFANKFAFASGSFIHVPHPSMEVSMISCVFFPKAVYSISTIFCFLWVARLFSFSNFADKIDILPSRSLSIRHVSCGSLQNSQLHSFSVLLFHIDH